jgi:hypothetical protein
LLDNASRFKRTGQFHPRPKIDGFGLIFIEVTKQVEPFVVARPFSKRQRRLAAGFFFLGISPSRNKLPSL